MDSLESQIFKAKLANAKDPCPKCGRNLEVIWIDDFINDAIKVRHGCMYCGLQFNPDGTTEPLITLIESQAQLQAWKAEKEIMDDATSDAVKEAESILKGANNAAR